MTPLVSILIPCYNQPQYILQAVNSALAQDYPNLEVVVADDSTNNETQQALSIVHDPKLRVIKNNQRLGRVVNYRTLLYDHADGDWVLMLDGDDYLTTPNYISRAMDTVSRDPRIVLIGARINVFNENDQTTTSFGLERSTSVFDGKELFEKDRRLPNHQTDIYPRKLACSLDFYNDPSTGSDSESLYRLALNGKVAYFAEPVAVWRVHQQNTTYTRDISKQLQEMVFIDKVYAYALPKVGKQTASAWRAHQYKFITLHFLNMAVKAKNKAAIAKLLWKNGSYLGVQTSVRYLIKSFAI